MMDGLQEIQIGKIRYKVFISASHKYAILEKQDGTRYFVSEGFCDCKGFFYKKKCKHTAWWKEIMKEVRRDSYG